MNLRFLRNKVVEVEPQRDETLAVSWRLTDDLLEVEVQIQVRPPELEIVEAKARLSRFPAPGCENASELIKGVEGVAIGPGLRKIVRGLLGREDGCSLLADAVLESANAVILHFTRPRIQLGESVTDPEQRMELNRAMVQVNPRLIRSCVAFQDDSPIMQGLKKE